MSERGQPNLVTWARTHLRNNELMAVDEKIAEHEEELRRLRERRRWLMIRGGGK